MKQFLIALDQLANTLIPLAGDGFGMADESISARAWRLRDRSNAWKWIDRVFFWEPRHCEQSYNSELLRSQLPKGYGNVDQLANVALGGMVTTGQSAPFVKADGSTSSNIKQIGGV